MWLASVVESKYCIIFKYLYFMLHTREILYVLLHRHRQPWLGSTLQLIVFTMAMQQQNVRVTILTTCTLVYFYF